MLTGFDRPKDLLAGFIGAPDQYRLAVAKSDKSTNSREKLLRINQYPIQTGTALFRIERLIGIEQKNPFGELKLDWLPPTHHAEATF